MVIGKKDGWLCGETGGERNDEQMALTASPRSTEAILLAGILWIPYKLALPLMKPQLRKCFVRNYDLKSLFLLMLLQWYYYIRCRLIQILKLSLMLTYTRWLEDKVIHGLFINNRQFIFASLNSALKSLLLLGFVFLIALFFYF